METDNLKHILSIVEEAHNRILLANGCRDGRKRDKLIREAKADAQSIVMQHELEIRELCNLPNENGMDDLFSWGFLEGDLNKVSKILKEQLAKQTY